MDGSGVKRDIEIGGEPLTIDAVWRIAHGLAPVRLSKGAKALSGGKADSVLMPATVVDGVTPSMNLYRDESFGPIVAIIRASMTGLT